MMVGHLGYDKRDQAGSGSGNSRNGTRVKTVIAKSGRVEIRVPRGVEDVCIAVGDGLEGPPGDITATWDLK